MVVCLSADTAIAFTKRKKMPINTGEHLGKCQHLNPSLAFPSEPSSLDPLPCFTSGTEEVVVLAGIEEAQVVPPAVNWRRHFLIMTTAYTRIIAKRGAGRHRSLLLTWKKGPGESSLPSPSVGFHL